MTQASQTPGTPTTTPQSTTGARERSDPAIEAAEAEFAPSQQGSAGGTMAREVGQRDEAKTAAGGDPLPTPQLPTGVDGRDKPEDGDLPTRLQTRE